MFDGSRRSESREGGFSFVCTLAGLLTGFYATGLIDCGMICGWIIVV